MLRSITSDVVPDLRSGVGKGRMNCRKRPPFDVTLMGVPSAVHLRLLCRHRQLQYYYSRCRSRHIPPQHPVYERTSSSHHLRRCGILHLCLTWALVPLQTSYQFLPCMHVLMTTAKPSAKGRGSRRLLMNRKRCPWRTLISNTDEITPVSPPKLLRKSTGCCRPPKLSGS